jgi:alkylation response protein AidB-like acyl-CoA dehydrogenase
VILEETEAIETRSQLRDVVGSVIARVSPPSGAVARADAAASGRFDTGLWTRLGREVGVVGLTVPEKWGGGGAGFAEIAVVFEACGRARAAVTLFGSWLVAEAIVRAGDPAVAERWLPRLVSGSGVGAVAWPDVPPVAVRDGDGWRLTGGLDRVVDGLTADVLVTPAQTPDGPILVAATLDGVARTRQESLDLTRQLARLSLADTPAQALVTGAALPGFRETLRDIAAAALSCEQLGVAEQALDDAVSYAKQREQFGRLIGSFQAVKHLLADLATATDLARSLVEHAVWAATERPDALRTAAAMAYVQSSSAACLVSAENVQVHGGIGFSWEHSAHLHFRKARSNAVLLGDRYFFADRLLTALGVTGADE